MTGGSNTILAPNQSVTVAVSFNPKAAGNFGQCFCLESRNALNISLSGTAARVPTQRLARVGPKSFDRHC